MHFVITLGPSTSAVADSLWNVLPSPASSYVDFAEYAIRMEEDLGFTLSSPINLSMLYIHSSLPDLLY